MAKLINGNGNRAIYAAQDADLIASLAGNVTCIANVGNKYAATIEDANTIGLADGVIITKEGRRIQLDAGDVDLFAIPTGSSGVTNYYIIGYKLVQQADSSQVAETFVQKMNSSSETIAEGTLRGGDNEVFVSVYRVTQVGFTISSVEGLLPELLDSAAVKDDIDQINSNLAQINPVILTSGYTVQLFQTVVKIGVAYLYFLVKKYIDYTTPIGVTALIIGGTPKPLLNSGETMLIAPCTVYATGDKEFASSLQIGTTGQINFIITQQMVDEAIAAGTLIELSVVCEISYVVDPD